MVPRLASLVLMTALVAPATAVADDPVLEWMGIMNTVVLTPPATNPLYTSRNVGLVGAAVFDAVNGIEKRYRPLMVAKYTGPHASARAAAIQAAYAMLLHLYPGSTTLLNTKLATSLAAISSGPDADHAKEIRQGRAYGQAVADMIFAARSSDGFAPDSDDQTALAKFWAGNTALFWNRTAIQVAASRNLSLVDTARLFGLLNVAIADAAIACWDVKFRFVYWRPVTAIQQGGADGNDLTAPDAAWTPLLGVTPAHPEYVSGHSTVSGAAQHVLATIFGDDVPFFVDSEVPGSTTRWFTSFSGALAEIHNARVFGGIHFRTACLRGSQLGVNVADWVMSHAMTEKGDH